MNYTILFYNERFEVTGNDKAKIEQAIDEDMKFVVLESGRKIDPIGVKDFKPVQDINMFDINDFDYGESHKKAMLEKLSERRIMFRDFMKYKGLLAGIKAKGLVASEKEKEVLREEYKMIEAKTRGWTELIEELKKKDARPTEFTEEIQFFNKTGWDKKKATFNNKTNKVKIY